MKKEKIEAMRFNMCTMMDSFDAVRDAATKNKVYAGTNTYSRAWIKAVLEDYKVKIEPDHLQLEGLVDLIFMFLHNQKEICKMLDSALCAER